MSTTCKHGHTDGVMHIPCYQCQCETLEAENARMKRELEAVSNAHIAAEQIIGRLQSQLSERDRLIEGARVFVKTRECYCRQDHVCARCKMLVQLSAPAEPKEKSK